MRSVVWSQRALDDFDRIIDYVAARDRAATLRVIDGIEQAGENLGHTTTGRPGRVSGTYEKVVSGLPYILAYTVQAHPDGQEAIIILRAIHGARDWPPEQRP